MKRLEKYGSVFFVDEEKTREYYAVHSLCECQGCKNFYCQAKGRLPELDAFLSEFGVDISRPDETPWWEMDGQIEYNPWYTVTGHIETAGRCELSLGDLHIVISKGDSPLDDVPNEQSDPYFVIAVFNVNLPWVLNEPFPFEPERGSLLTKLSRLFKK